MNSSCTLAQKITWQSSRRFFSSSMVSSITAIQERSSRDLPAIRWFFSGIGGSRLKVTLSPTRTISLTSAAQSPVSPVSYTHLDVYKRQLYCIPLLKRWCPFQSSKRFWPRPSRSAFQLHAKRNGPGSGHMFKLDDVGRFKGVHLLDDTETKNAMPDPFAHGKSAAALLVL